MKLNKTNIVHNFEHNDIQKQTIQEKVENLIEKRCEIFNNQNLWQTIDNYLNCANKNLLKNDKIFNKLSNIENNFNDEKISIKIFNTFNKEIKNESQTFEQNLKIIDNHIKDIKNNLLKLSKNEINLEKNKVEDKVNLKSKTTPKKVELKQVAPHGPITIRPKQKKEGLFNDINLTEDYELGFRFHELGFKTGFFNVKLDEDDDSSRIATAEFFPNTFWAAVKQRSRWVAGIVFQNWKSHKWSGNLVTKYFLFRDRKSVFSFFSAFLSNVVLLYLVFAVISKIFQWTHVNSLVGHSSVLWLLMISNLVFMISRLSHRFIFTYNWYGFSYAFFSLFRLPVDTIVNFFAIARSFSVYKNTKSKAKVVWDSTTHY